MIEWPGFFPNNCPPDDAKDTDSLVFRLVSGPTFTKSDFRSYRETHPNRNFGKLECQACGLSVFLDYNNAVQTKLNVPGFARKQIAMCKLSPDDGAIKATPSLQDNSHHTWWMNPIFPIMEKFEIVS